MFNLKNSLSFDRICMIIQLKPFEDISMTKYFLILFCMLGLACKSTNQTTENPPITIPDDFSFSLERTGCHGQCPIFSMTVMGNGDVFYQGEAFVPNVGKYTKNIGPETVKAIIEEVEKVNYWRLNEMYNDPQIMDLPSCITSCTMNEKSHKVVNRFNAPDKLIQFEKKIEELVGQDGYVKMKK